RAVLARVEPGSAALRARAGALRGRDGRRHEMDRTEEILAFWFGSLPTTAAELERRMIVWFGGAEPERQAERDREIRERFGELIERAAAGELAGWAGTP